MRALVEVSQNTQIENMGKADSDVRLRDYEETVLHVTRDVTTISGQNSGQRSQLKYTHDPQAGKLTGWVGVKRRTQEMQHQSAGGSLS